MSQIKPTHWMDDLGRIATDEFMRSDAAHSDYQACYTIPGVIRRGKFVPIEQEQPTSHGAGGVGCVIHVTRCWHWR